MKTFIALAGGLKHIGSFNNCIIWSRTRIAQAPLTPIKIVVYRFGDKEGRIIAEVTSEGVRRIRYGRRITKTELKKYGQIKAI